MNKDELHSWFYEVNFSWTPDMAKAQVFADKAMKKVNGVFELEYNPDYLDFQKGVLEGRKLERALIESEKAVA